MPTNPVVKSGTASFSQTGNALTVTNSNGAIIHWDSFSIGKGNSTYFAQPSASSAVLNRVVGADPSLIYGTLSSNGRVWLINPNGITVGPGGMVNTAQFVASTLNVSNANFLAGKLTFDKTPGAADVVNQGSITTSSGGSVYLVGTNVSNEGVITTPQGETLLAAGETVNLIDTGTPGVKVEITGAAGNTTNLGEIVADAGRIGMAGVIVRNSGALNASSVVNQGGRIFLKASQDTYVDGSGRIVATGTKGGRVEVLGDRVAVMDNAGIDVSGTNGGGTVLVGGDYQGKNPDIQNARISYFGANAAIKADATGNGDGGKVIVWADDTTRAYGSISARGGANAGNGGFVETSGHYLDFNARVDTRAPAGTSGTLLLDPTSIDIYATGYPDSYGGGTFTGSPWVLSGGSSGATIYGSTIATALGSSAVVLSTDGGTGDINIHAGTYDFTSVGNQNNLYLVAYGGSTSTGNINATNADIRVNGWLVLFAGWNGDTQVLSGTIGPTHLVSDTTKGTVQLTGSSISAYGSWIYSPGTVNITDSKVSTVDWLGVQAQNLNVEDLTAYNVSGLATGLVSGGHQQLLVGDTLTIRGSADSSYGAAGIGSDANGLTVQARQINLYGGGTGTAGVHDSYAVVYSYGGMDITAANGGVGGISIYGGGTTGGYKNEAGFEHGDWAGGDGMMMVTLATPGSSINIYGGAGTGYGGPGDGNCYGGCQTSSNSAGFFNNYGGATFSFNGTGNSINIYGGGAAGDYGYNAAGIESNTGTLTIGSDTSRPDITLTGGTAGGYFGYDVYSRPVQIDNSAHISGNGTADAIAVYAGTISMYGGTADVGGAFISGANTITVDTSHDLIMQGGTGSDAYHFPWVGNAAAIVNEGPASINLNIGGSLTMNSGSGLTSGALIGSIFDTAQVLAQVGGDVSLTANGAPVLLGAGSADGYGGGQVAVFAGGNIALTGSASSPYGSIYIGSGNDNLSGGINVALVAGKNLTSRGYGGGIYIGVDGSTNPSADNWVDLWAGAAAVGAGCSAFANANCMPSPSGYGGNVVLSHTVVDSGISAIAGVSLGAYGGIAADCTSTHGCIVLSDALVTTQGTLEAMAQNNLSITDAGWAGLPGYNTGFYSGSSMTVAARNVLSIQASNSTSDRSTGLSSDGDMTLVARQIDLHGGGTTTAGVHDSSAIIYSYGGMDITAGYGGAGGIAIYGGGTTNGYNNTAGILHGDWNGTTQAGDGDLTISFATAGSTLAIYGGQGSGSGGYTSGCGGYSNCPTSNNGASIENNYGGLTISYASGSGNALTLTGGGASGGDYGYNDAYMLNRGGTLQIGSADARPDITLTGGAYGGWLGTNLDGSPNEINNSANISNEHASGPLVIYGGSISLYGGSANSGGAHIGAGNVHIDTTGDLTMIGGSGGDSTYGASPWVGASVGIGKVSAPVTVRMNIGGNLTLHSGTNSADAALIGSVQNTADVKILAQGDIDISVGSLAPVVVGSAMYGAGVDLASAAGNIGINGGTSAGDAAVYIGGGTDTARSVNVGLVAAGDLTISGHYGGAHIGVMSPVNGGNNSVDLWAGTTPSNCSSFLTCSTASASSTGGSLHLAKTHVGAGGAVGSGAYMGAWQVGANGGDITLTDARVFSGDELQVNAGHDLSITDNFWQTGAAGNLGTGLVSIGDQSVTVGNRLVIRASANTSYGGAGLVSNSSSNSAMTVNARQIDIYGGGTGTAGVHDSTASISSYGGLTVNAAVGGSGGISIYGGGTTGGYNNEAGIEHGYWYGGTAYGAGAMAINLATTQSAISIYGGAGTGSGGWTDTDCSPACSTSSNGAGIENRYGDLTITYTGLTNGLTLVGGGAAGDFGYNDAHIHSDGNLTIGGSAGAGPNITLVGGSQGGRFGGTDVNGRPIAIDNSASISVEGSSAGNLVIYGGTITMNGGSADFGGAFIGGSNSIQVYTTGDLLMYAGSGYNASYPWIADSVGIGNDKHAPNIGLHVGGNLIMDGGTYYGSMAMIGSIDNSATVAITAAQGIGAYGNGGGVGIGSLASLMGTTAAGTTGVTLTAGGNVAFDANAGVAADNLTVSGYSVSLLGAMNKVGTVDVTTTGLDSAGNINLNLGSGATSTLAGITTHTDAGTAQTIAFYSGNFNVSGFNAGSDNLALYSGDTIGQSGIITAASLYTTSVNGTNLGLSNSVDTYSGYNSGTGDITFVNGKSLVLEGQSGAAYSYSVMNQATGGAVQITASGTLYLGHGNDSAIEIGANGNVSLTALGATSDLISRPYGSTASISSMAGNITLSAGRDVLLGVNSTGAYADVYTEGMGNSIGITAGRDILVDNYTFVDTYQGDVTLSAGRNIAIRSSINPYASWVGAGGNLTISAPNGYVYVPAVGEAVPAGAPTTPGVTATADVGGGRISATGLTTITAKNGITATNYANMLTNLSMTNTTAGGIRVANTTNYYAAYTGAGYTAAGYYGTYSYPSLTIAGATSYGGTLSIDNVGGIVVAGNMSSDGGLSLTAHSPITVNGGATLRAVGDLTLSAMSSSSTSTTDLLTIGGTLTSTTGNIGLLGGSGITLASTASLSATAGSIAATSPYGQIAVDPGAALNSPSVTMTGAAPIVIAPPPPPSTSDAVISSIVTSTTTATTTDNSQNSPATTTLPPPTTSGTTGSLASLGTQTIGGTSGQFGSTDTSSSTSTGSSFSTTTTTTPSSTNGGTSSSSTTDSSSSSTTTTSSSGNGSSSASDSGSSSGSGSGGSAGSGSGEGTKTASESKEGESKDSGKDKKEEKKSDSSSGEKKDDKAGKKNVGKCA